MESFFSSPSFYTLGYSLVETGWRGGRQTLKRAGEKSSRLELEKTLALGVFDCQLPHFLFSPATTTTKHYRPSMVRTVVPSGVGLWLELRGRYSSIYAEAFFLLSSSSTHYTGVTTTRLDQQPPSSRPLESQKRRSLAASGVRLRGRQLRTDRSR